MYVFDYKVILHKYTKDNCFLKKANNIKWYNIILQAHLYDFTVLYCGEIYHLYDFNKKNTLFGELIDEIMAVISDDGIIPEVIELVYGDPISNTYKLLRDEKMTLRGSLKLIKVWKRSNWE